MGGAIFHFSQKIGLKSTKNMRFCILHKPMGGARAPPRPPPGYATNCRGLSGSNSRRFMTPLTLRVFTVVLSHKLHLAEYLSYWLLRCNWQFVCNGTGGSIIWGDVIYILRAWLFNDGIMFLLNGSFSCFCLILSTIKSYAELANVFHLST